MPKKLFALAFSLSVCAALFSGCWWNNDDSSSSSTASSYSQSTGSSGSMSSSVPNNLTGSSSGSMSNSMSGSTSGSSSGSMSSSISGSSSDTAVANASAASLSWQTRIVNAQNPLPEDFAVAVVNVRGYEDRLFDARAATALEAMLSAAEESGNKLYLVSAYRSISRQKTLYTRKVNYYINEGQSKLNAEQAAARWVARPGTSEHNLGLAADIVSANWYKSNSDLTGEFENTQEFEWLYTHCADYGFILRYPKNKTDITGIEYEPWHYRYVGQDIARQIMSSEIALEEFILQ